MLNTRAVLIDLDCYIIGWTLVGAIILYGAGGHIAFIDALFFASGSATQSGLNT